MFVFPVERIEHFNSRYESRSVTSRIFSAVEKLRKLQDGKHGAAVEDHRDLLQGTTCLAGLSTTLSCFHSIGNIS